MSLGTNVTVDLKYSGRSVVVQMSLGRSIKVLATPPEYQDLFSNFQDVANPSGRMPTSKHGVQHVLETTGRLVTAKFRRLDPDKFEAAKSEFLRMEQEGIIWRSRSCWASPLHMVRKADGSWWPFGDYQRFNLVTVADRYPVLNMQDLSARLHDCAIFSKLDLKKGYYQIPMRPEDIPHKPIIMPFGLWEFTRMPFGFKNAGQTFRRLMDRVGSDLPYVFIYLDDILVASPDVESHKVHLRTILQRLCEFGLVLNIKKCEPGCQSVDFLGHRILSIGVEPLHKHVEAIQQHLRPAEMRALQSSLGLVNFYRRCIPAAARILWPLTDALRGSGKVKIFWTQTMESAFSEAKEAICNATSLAYPDPAARLSLAVDALDLHVGGVLQQLTMNGSQPLAFFSAKLSYTEQKYHKKPIPDTFRTLKQILGVT
jgi:hypothetical protein